MVRDRKYPVDRAKERTTNQIAGFVNVPACLEKNKTASFLDLSVFLFKTKTNINIAYLSHGSFLSGAASASADTAKTTTAASKVLEHE